MKTKPHFQLARRAKTKLLLLSIIGALSAASPIQAASLSELLEQGIYSEQTKGDLDAAMQAYQKVVQEAKAGEALAAQAQYRLGVCLYKKKDFPEATAAFEKLVKNYPDQTELVKLANEYLAGATTLLPVPWTDGEEMRMDIRFPSGIKVGAASYTIDAAERDGRKIWRTATILFAGGVRQVSQVDVDAQSFRPIHSRWKHSLIGESEVTFLPNKAEMKLKGQPDLVVKDLESLVFDNEQAAQLFRRLPLSTNYQGTVNIFTGLGGGNVIPLGLEVSKLESVKVPAGTFQCYRLELSLKQTFWISSDEHRYLVKFEAGGIAAELAEVRQRDPAALVPYTDGQLNFTLKAPPQWLCDRAEDQDTSRSAVMFMDPDGAAMARLNVQGLDKLKSEEQQSPRTWADREALEAGKSLKDFKIRPDSWKSLTIAGNPAVSAEADYTDGQEKMISYAVFLQADGKAFKFILNCAAEDFADLKAKFDSIAQSCRKM